MDQALLLLVLDFDRFQVLGLEDLAAVQTFHVVHAVSPGNNLGAIVVTSGLHSQRFR
jgi:hypothetical protein